MVLISIVYLTVGGALCYLFEKNTEDYFENSIGENYGTMLAVFTGIAWPIVAPFTFAILFAKKKGVK